MIPQDDIRTKNDVKVRGPNPSLIKVGLVYIRNFDHNSYTDIIVLLQLV